LGDSVGSELYGARAALWLGVALADGVGAGPRELRAPLELGGSKVLGATLVGSGVGGFSALGDSTLDWESLIVASGLMSCKALHKKPN
jgi:hypothetical protein